MKKNIRKESKVISPVLFCLLVVSFGVMILALTQSGYVEISNRGINFSQRQTGDYAGVYRSKEISMTLNPDGTADMDGKKGIWRNGANGLLTVNLEHSNLSFVHQEVNGVMEARLIDFDKNIWGQTGLVLQHINPLLNSKWVWVETKLVDGKITKNVKGDRFSLAFDEKGKVLVGTDCNGMSATYKVQGTNNISIIQGMSTKKYCAGSNEASFFKILGQVESYILRDGKLIMHLAKDAGTMTFTMTK